MLIQQTQYTNLNKCFLLFYLSFDWLVGCIVNGAQVDASEQINNLTKGKLCRFIVLNIENGEILCMQ